MTTTTLDSLLAHDSSDMLGAAATLPTQLPDGLARAARAREAIQTSWIGDMGATPRTLVVCGMGGSGVGAGFGARRRLRGHAAGGGILIANGSYSRTPSAKP